MNSSQIEANYKAILSLINKGRLKLVFDKTRTLVYELQNGAIIDQYEDILRNYRFMLQYFMSGSDDPERKTIYNKQIARLISLVSLVKEELLFRNSTGFEYTEKRYLPHKQQYSSISDLYDGLIYYHNQHKILMEAEAPSEEEQKRIRANYERLLLDVFAIFWLNTRMQDAEREMFAKIMDDNYPGMPEKSLIASALSLNTWRMFDKDKIMMLIDLCQHTDIQVRQRALTGLVFVLTRYNHVLPYYPSIRNRLVLLADDAKTLEQLKNIILIIIGTTETDRITKKMNEEILPEMMKLGPKLKEKMEEDYIAPPQEWEEENPEWRKMLEDSEIGDKLQELTELQLEGADVYMSTFSMLKSFPFFNEFAHWFMPFDPGFSDINELFNSKDTSIFNAFLSNSIICNSDKYSFCLSVLQMPFGQQDMMGHSFKAETEQLEEIQKDESMLQPDLVERNTARQYIQDIFRFFKLHPQRSAFVDMFKYSLHIHKTVFFDLLASSGDIKMQVAEFYFNKKLYKQSIDLFSILIKEEEPSAANYQKLGFAYQMTSQIDKALEAYVMADMIQPDDLWTVKKIAFCNRVSGNFQKALEEYRHADFLQPNQYSTNMQIANCLTQLKEYKEALEIYKKLEDLYPENIKISRAISWCAFLAKDIAQAAYYSEKVISEQAKAIDYLNAGHIAFAHKKRTEALAFYKKSISLHEDNLQLVVEQMENDQEHLISNGLDKDEIILMIDELSFSTEA